MSTKRSRLVLVVESQVLRLVPVLMFLLVAVLHLLVRARLIAVVARVSVMPALQLAVMVVLGHS